MNTTLCKVFFSVVVSVWSFGSSGCANTPAVKKTAPPQEANVLFDAEARPAAVEMLIDAETFTAFCDRA
jgi:hypothetical protein